MDSIMNKSRLAKKEIRLNFETKKTTKLQKQYELNQKRALNREQNESNKERNKNKRKQKREDIINEEINLGRFFELAASEKIYFTRFKFTLNEKRKSNRLYR